jgi:hypothetical protein
LSVHKLRFIYKFGNMKALSADTTPEAQRKHYELMRRLTPTKRLALALELTHATRQLIISDLHHRFPDAGDEEIKRRFIARVLPREDVIRVYAFDPQEEGY